jgi:hypothetical protein
MVEIEKGQVSVEPVFGRQIGINSGADLVHRRGIWQDRHVVSIG